MANYGVVTIGGAVESERVRLEVNDPGTLDLRGGLDTSFGELKVTTFTFADGTSMSTAVVASAATTQAAISGACAVISADATVTNPGPYDVAFGAEYFDDSAWHSNVTNNGRLTTPAAQVGNYALVCGYLDLVTGGATTNAFGVVWRDSGGAVKTNGNVATQGQVPGGTSNRTGITNTAMFGPLASGDYVDSYLFPAATFGGVTATYGEVAAGYLTQLGIAAFPAATFSGAKGYNVVNPTIASGANVTFDTEAFDVGGWFTAGTDRITVPAAAAGRDVVVSSSLTVVFGATAPLDFTATLKRYNSANVLQETLASCVGSTTAAGQLNPAASLAGISQAVAAGDYFTIEITYAGGASFTVAASFAAIALPEAL